MKTLQKYMKPFKNKIKSDDGTAIVELVLMLPFIFVLMMFLIIVYAMVNKMIDSQHKVRYDYRLATEIEATNNFNTLEMTDTAMVIVPGKMKNVLRHSIIKMDINLYGYAGCYQHTGKSKFKKRFLYREITQ